MKYKVIVNEDVEERVEIYVKRRNSLVDQIEQICKNDE